MALADNLVSYWKLDEASGTRADAHGSDDLTELNTVGSTTGVQSNAALIVAANSEALRNSSVPVSGSTARTVAFWVKPDSPADGASLFSFGLNVSGQRFTIANISGNLRIAIEGAGYTTSLSPTNGAWNFVAVTFDGVNLGGITIYLNGASESATGSNTLNTTYSTLADALYIGSGRNNVGNYNGAFDEFAIWARELSASEIGQVYNSGSGITYETLTSPATTTYRMNMRIGIGTGIGI